MLSFLMLLRVKALNKKAASLKELRRLLFFISQLVILKSNPTIRYPLFTINYFFYSLTIVCSLSGPTDTMVMGTSSSSSRYWM